MVYGLFFTLYANLSPVSVLLVKIFLFHSKNRGSHRFDFPSFRRSRSRWNRRRGGKLIGETWGTWTVSREVRSLQGGTADTWAARISSIGPSQTPPILDFLSSATRNTSRARVHYGGCETGFVLLRSLVKYQSDLSIDFEENRVGSREKDPPSKSFRTAGLASRTASPRDRYKFRLIYKHPRYP